MPSPSALATNCASVARGIGQLLFDLPLPVLNTIVPFTALIVITAWLIGDPFAIKLSSPELRQERA